MKKYLFLFALISSFVGLQAQNEDPVIMSVNGKDIKKSEFEYIYNKNNTETAIDKKSLDEYVELFKNFKLKVVEAEAQGMDTTQVFLKEFNEYRSVLAKPYLESLEIDEALIEKEYARHKDLLEASYIVLLFPEDPDRQGKLFPADTLALYEKANAIRNRFKKGEKFAALAKEFSADTRSLESDNPGYIGWVSAERRLDPVLANVLYDTPIGQLTEPIRTRFGYFLFYVSDRKPSPGRVRASHILVLARDGSPQDVMVSAKNKIDSIYDLLSNGADFAELAKEHSDDGSAAKGGDLSWFSSGQMVKEFDETVYSLGEVGEISKPIKTQFGYHIIQLTGKRDYPTYEELKADLEAKIKSSNYMLDLYAPAIERMKKEHNFLPNNYAMDNLRYDARTVFPTEDNFAEERMNQVNMLFKIGDDRYYAYDLVKYINKNPRSNYSLSTDYLNDKLDNYIYELLLEKEDKSLENKYPEFRNLAQEYRDGILLFEVSNKEVWDRSSSDTEGLTAFFEENKSNYTWDKPHFKGYVVLASDNKTKKKMQKEIKKMTPDAAAQYLQDNYRVGTVTQVRLERGLWIEGENSYVDEIVFKKGKATTPEGFETFFVIGKLLDNPEAYTDVRGQVITDYQDYLEQNWLKELNNKYSVVINEDVLKTVK